MKTAPLRTATLTAAMIVLSGCATGGAAYVPIIDGPKDQVYTQDLTDCQGFAESREYLNSDTKTAALTGAAVGGLIAATNNSGYSRRHRHSRKNRNSDLENFAAGALVGALFSGGKRALQTRKERKYIVLDCMAGRGHRVLG